MTLVLRRFAVAVAVLVTAVAVVSCAPPSSDPSSARPAAPSTPAADRPDRDAAPGDVLEIDGADAARPVRVRIPSLAVTSSLDDIGVLADGTLERPPRWQVAGWYADGPRPGDTGPAVIAGHVDSPTGPAVFAGLEELTPGDLVEVDGDDGSTATFRVDRLQAVPRGRFPTRAVYGQTPDSQLRLITCDGPYDAVDGYRDNLIVFATLVT